LHFVACLAIDWSADFQKKVHLNLGQKVVENRGLGKELGRGEEDYWSAA
jgi:hypothetical protein